MITDFRGPYWFLSNFFPSPVHYGDRMWLSAEHAYQAAKTSDAAWRSRIQATDSGAKAKQMGSRYLPSNLIRRDWDVVRVPIMTGVLAAKFDEGSRLAIKLVETRPHVIEHWNTWGDDFWGKVEVITGNGHVHQWLGEDWLGRLLMERRTWLKSLV